MRIGPLVRIATRHLTHDAYRTSIAIGSVALGVCLTITMSAMMDGFTDKFVKDTIEASPHITVYDEPKGGPGEMLPWSSRKSGAVLVGDDKPRERKDRIKKPAEILRVLAAHPEVEAATENVVGTCLLRMGSREAAAALMGIRPDRQERVVSTEEYMRVGRLRSLYSASGGVILGSGLAAKLGAKMGDSVLATLRSGGARTMRVVGLFHTGVVAIDDARAYTLIGVAQQLLASGRDVNRLAVRLRDYRQAGAVAREVEAWSGYKCESWQEANENVLSMLAVQKVIISCVTAGLILVSAFGILNIMVMLVMEKLPEIAVLKSIGYRASDIGAIFLLEGAVVGLLGSCMGASWGHYLMKLLATFPIPLKSYLETERLIFHETAGQYLLATIAAFATSLFASGVPAMRAARLDPVETLRGHR